MQRPNYTVIVRSSKGSFSTIPTDSYHSLLQKTRELLSELLRDGSITKDYYTETIERVRSLIIDARDIQDELRERQKIMYLEQWQKMRERGGLLK